MFSAREYEMKKATAEAKGTSRDVCIICLNEFDFGRHDVHMCEPCLKDAKEEARTHLSESKREMRTYVCNNCSTTREAQRGTTQKCCGVEEMKDIGHSKTKPPSTYIKDNSTTCAIRYDADKIDWSILPLAQMNEVIKVLEFGAKKYSRDNWKKGFVFSRCFNSAMRHLVSWFFNRQDKDQESGLNHLAHVIVNCLFLLYYQETNGDDQTNDDRPSVGHKGGIQ